MKVCPRCKEDMPQLSKICPVCGYVDESNIRVEDMMLSMQDMTLQLQKIPHPGFMKSMASLTYLIYPILFVFMLVAALISEAGLFWVLSLLFLVLGIVAMIKKAKGKLGNELYNTKFKEIKLEFESLNTIAKLQFGKNRDVSTMLSEMSNKITDLENNRKAMARKNIIVWVLILVVIVACSSGGVFSLNKFVEDSMPANQKIEQLLETDNWRDALIIFKKENGVLPEIGTVSHNMIKSMLGSDSAKEAEEFFYTYCMGKVGDWDCATLIVNYYNKTKNPGSAKEFVGRCNMRYGSDKDKLMKQISK